MLIGNSSIHGPFSYVYPRVINMCLTSISFWMVYSPTLTDTQARLAPVGTGSTAAAGGCRLKMFVQFCSYPGRSWNIPKRTEQLSICRI